MWNYSCNHLQFRRSASNMLMNPATEHTVHYPTQESTTANRGVPPSLAAIFLYHSQLCDIQRFLLMLSFLRHLWLLQIMIHSSQCTTKSKSISMSVDHTNLAAFSIFHSSQQNRKRRCPMIVSEMQTISYEDIDRRPVSSRLINHCWTAFITLPKLASWQCRENYVLSQIINAHSFELQNSSDEVRHVFAAHTVHRREYKA